MVLIVTNNKKMLIALIVYMVNPLGGMIIDMYVPALPDIKNFLHTTTNLTQWTFTIAILGFGLGQLISGSLSDIYGRRKVILSGIAIQLVLFIALIYARNIQLFILLRALQGLSIALICIPARAIIKDIYSGDQFMKAMNWVTTTFAMGMILSPFLGSLFTAYLGWHSVFWFLFVYVFVAGALIYFVVPETSSGKSNASISNIKKNYAELLGNKRFLIMMVMAGTFSSALPAFNTIGPFLIQDVMHLSALDYGRIALLLGASWFLGNFTSRLLFNLSKNVKTVLCFSASLISVLLVIGYLSYGGGLNLFVLVAPLVVVIFSAAILFPI